MKRTNSCTTKKSFAEISIFLASKWFFISIFVVTILCYMTPVYYGDGVSEMSTLELLRLKANPSFAIEPMQYQISVILPRAVQGYLAMFVPVLRLCHLLFFNRLKNPDVINDSICSAPPPQDNITAKNGYSAW